jgi:hypothetical protein
MTLTLDDTTNPFERSMDFVLAEAVTASEGMDESRRVYFNAAAAATILFAAVSSYPKYPEWLAADQIPDWVLSNSYRVITELERVKSFV